MDKVSIRDGGLSDASLIRELAEKTWWPTYSPILEKEQLQYMLNLIYSETALQSVIKDGSQHFIILSDERGPQGFASFGKRKEDDGIFKLHKLYVLPDNHGKGYGKALIMEVKSRLERQGIHTLDLNVNRFNTAKSFYEKLGFVVIAEEDVPIGPYWMNDFVMRLVF
jgi:diamine N-acetyltransferase